ncbi:hypothetical protein [Microbacterium sp. NPDC057650]|uniref:hypothetical protein n=1 Tax=unclassified Microbacterium TaxID=2609290 RepID=UPI003671C5F5
MAHQEQLLVEVIATYGSRAEAAMGDHGSDFGLCQIHANERWHFEYRVSASQDGCPRAYPDPTYDPRLQ